MSARRSPMARRPTDPVLWPTDVGRLHRRMPTIDPAPIVIESAKAWRLGSRRSSGLLAGGFTLAAAVALLLFPVRVAVLVGGVAVVLATVSLWRAIRGPFVYSWVFADDGVGYRRRDGLVAWVGASRVARFEAKVVPGPIPTLVVRVRDWKRHVVLSAKPGGFDPTELLQAAALKGYRVAGEES